MNTSPDKLDKSDLASRVLEHYTAEEWKDAIDRAKLYALKRGYGNESSPHDLVHEAILRLLDGQRQWTPEYPLAQQLIHSVRSIQSHEKKKYSRFIDITDLAENETETSPNPENELAIEQELALVKKTIDKGNDKLAKDLVNAIEINGFERHENTELARTLGVSIKDITNAKKRIKRLLGKNKT